MVNKELSLSVKTAETSAIATWLKSENVFSLPYWKKVLLTVRCALWLMLP